MEKSVKLQRYDRKDYTELVEFPVEIVGRDGVVRRYSFEDSIRLYQRRITFAHVRYRDPDLAHAEMNHCRSRIDQLRRSYFHRYGWGTPDGQRSAEENFGELAGEVAAFICRVLGVDGRPGVRLEPVGADDDGTTTWYLRRHDAGGDGSQSGMLLYFHRFGGSGADGIRDRFFATIKGLEAGGVRGGDAERLLAFHHTADCGFVLTGRGGDYESFVQPALDESPVDLETTGAPSAWDTVLDLIRKGDYEGGLHRCREIVVDQPYHRSAYVGGAMLASYLGKHWVGDELAEIGSRYFPNDGPLQYYLGLCRSRLGRRAEAEAALVRAVELAPDLACARGVLVTERLRQGRYVEAIRVLRQRRGVVPDDRRVESDLKLLERAVFWPFWGRIALLVAVPFAVALAVLTMSGVPLLIGLTGLVAERASRALFRRQLDAYTSRRRFEEIAQGLRQIHRRTRLPGTA